MERTLSREQIAAKKERREREGKANMARYREQQQRTLDRMARLRARRLALPGMNNPAKAETFSESNESAPRRTLPGLHQGVRR